MLVLQYHSIPVFVFGRCLVQLSANTSAFLTEVYRGFPQSIQENSMTVAQLVHEHFLLNPFQFIVHRTSYRLMLYSDVIKEIIIET
jgi:hypothetical protein